MKNTLENIIYITIFIILCFPQNVSAKKYLGNDVTYKEVTNYKGNVDLIQSAHAGILVEAYRLMNGLGMPDSKDRMEYNNYKNFYGGKEWKKRVEGILDIDTGDRWYGCVSKFAMILLDERIRKLGLSHPYIKSWLREQETVFSNCFYKNPLQLPNAFQINSDDSRELRNLKKYDHQYQLASSYFYAKQFNVAVDEYNKIIKEQASQYYATAHYMIARSLLNDRKYDAAYNKLKSIIADNRLKQIHQDARDLIGVVADRSSNENY